MSDISAGPWQAEKFEKNGLFGFQVKTADGAVIAEIYPQPWLVIVSEANAKLIAQAPDLLAACIDARETLQNVGWTHDDYAYTDEIAALDSVIRKAGGNDD